jgi:hypothetical protein
MRCQQDSDSRAFFAREWAEGRAKTPKIFLRFNAGEIFSTR